MCAESVCSLSKHAESVYNLSSLLWQTVAGYLVGCVTGWLACMGLCVSISVCVIFCLYHCVHFASGIGCLIMEYTGL